jgi:hypothetical protein
MMPSMKWDATAQRWVSKTKDERIVVTQATYEQHEAHYFQSRGVTRKTYYEIMQAAYAEWDRQHSMREAFAREVDYWLSCQDEGIERYPLSEPQIAWEDYRNGRAK